MSNFNKAELLYSIHEKQSEKFIKDTTSMEVGGTFYQATVDEPVELNTAALSENLSEISPSIIKNANRTIRSMITENEYKKLLSKRNDLIDKKFSDCLTKKEERKLGLLRWEIEGVEDAKAGPQLDKLEEMVEMRRTLSKELSNFLNIVKKVRN